MSLDLRSCAKRLCVEALHGARRPQTRSLAFSLPRRAGPPLPRSRDNRVKIKPGEDLVPLSQSANIQVTEGDFRERRNTAIALRQFWQTNFPSATFQNKEEFTKWYIKYSTILVFIVGGCLVYQRWQDTRPPEIIGPDHFTKLKVLSRTKISPDSLLIQLDLPKDALPPVQADTPVGLGAAIQSVYVADTDAMIQRPYTPLSAEVFDPVSDRNTGKLSLIVKRYEHGEVSKWLHSRAVGATVPVRGPVWTYDLRGKPVDDLVFIVAGTGITPAFQAISALYEPPELGKEQEKLLFGVRQNIRLESQHEAEVEASIAHMSWLDRFKAKVASIRETRDAPPTAPRPLSARAPRITVVHASPSTDSMLMRTTLEAYAAKHPGRIRVTFFADKLADPKHAERVARVGRLESRDLVKQSCRAKDFAVPERAAVVVCGPESFVDAVAGPRNAGAPLDAPVPVGGMLGQLGWTSEQVIRLDNAAHIASQRR